MIKGWSFRKHATVSIIIVGLVILFEVIISCIDMDIKLIIMSKVITLFSSQEVASIGVIGGADGPTAYFFTGYPLVLMILPKIVLFIMLLNLHEPMK